MRADSVTLLFLMGLGLVASLFVRELGAWRIETVLRERLQRENDRYRSLVESAPIGIASVAASSEVLSSNHSWLQIDVRNALNLMRDEPWSSTELPRRLQEAITVGLASVFETVFSERHVRMHVTRTHEQTLLVLVEDVSEQRALEKRAWAGQKMEAIGKTAAGVAHDFNNSLTAMMAGMELIRTHISEIPSAKHLAQALDLVEHAITNAAELTRRLLALASDRAPQGVLEDVSEVVSRALPIVRLTLPSNVMLIEAHMETHATASINASELEHAVINLCLNARDAMPHGGRLTVAVERVSLPTDPASWLEIRISDTGAGIPPELQERIFEPFLTTKELGHGTGLGLPMVLAFVNNHGGTITLDSAIGRGTTFGIRVPCAGQRATSVVTARAC